MLLRHRGLGPSLRVAAGIGRRRWWRCAHRHLSAGGGSTGGGSATAVAGQTAALRRIIQEASAGGAPLEPARCAYSKISGTGPSHLRCSRVITPPPLTCAAACVVIHGWLSLSLSPLLLHNIIHVTYVYVRARA
eukprot:COSAG01_NODE_1152_length_11492_cov_12.314842_10_plen_134_part_00